MWLTPIRRSSRPILWKRGFRSRPAFTWNRYGGRLWHTGCLHRFTGYEGLRPRAQVAKDIRHGGILTDKRTLSLTEVTKLWCRLLTLRDSQRPAGRAAGRNRTQRHDTLVSLLCRYSIHQHAEEEAVEQHPGNKPNEPGHRGERRGTTVQTAG